MSTEVHYSTELLESDVACFVVACSLIPLRIQAYSRSTATEQLPPPRFVTTFVSLYQCPGAF
jgi:hypothetical protein